jgi:hypothetical protein
MPTQGERLSALEQGLAAVQGDFLIHLSENNRQMAALNKVISTQVLHSRDIDHNLRPLRHKGTEVPVPHPPFPASPEGETGSWWR